MRITVRAWAESAGISRQAGYRAVSRCEIPIDASGRVDMEEATRLYRERTRSRALRARTLQRDAGACGNAADAPTNTPPAERPANPNGDGGNDGYRAARIRREEAEAALAEVRLAEVSGRLIDREAVRTEFGKQVVLVRDRLLRLPDRLTAILLGVTDARRMRTLIDAEVRAALVEFHSGDNAKPR